MTLRQALTRAREMLSSSVDTDNPVLESEVLLKHVLQIDRVQLYLDLDKDLDPEKEREFFLWVQRRIQGEPLAYIIRNREFFGLDFYVDARVLIPRPETELLVEEALCYSQNHPVNTIADIGTGSGAIAVSLAANLNILLSSSLRAPEPSEAISSSTKIYATDLSSAALDVARINCRRHTVEEQVILLQGRLLEPLPTPVDILIANLPYVSRADMAEMPSARYEPTLALDGGDSGLDQISQLIRQLEGKMNPGGCGLLEVGLGQSQTVIELLRDLYPQSHIKALHDLAGIERVIKFIL